MIESITNFLNENPSISAVLKVLLILIVLIILTKIIRHFFKYKVIKNPKLKLQQEAKTLLPFIEKVLLVIMWILGVITVLGNLGYDVSAFVAGAGIGGLAIAFAAQKSISNIFGAITILLNKPFKVGDSVKINGIIGTVKDIGLTYVELTEPNGHKVMVPNDATITSNIENLSVRKHRKTSFVIGVVYDTSLDKIKQGIEAIKEILEKCKTEKTISSYRVNFSEFGNFSLNIDVLYFSLYNDNFDEYTNQKEQINLEIKKVFEKLKIDMAFPTQEVIIKNVK